MVLGEAAVFTDTYDILLVRADDQGDTLWTKLYDGGGDESAFSIEPTSDGGYLITGTSWVMGGDLYLIKTDAHGDTMWTRRFNGGWHSWGYSGIETTDGGYIAVGWAIVSTDNLDVYVVRTDVNGDSLWTKRIGGDNRDEGRCIQQTSDGNYIIAGSYQSTPGYIGDVWLICLGNESSVGGRGAYSLPSVYRLHCPYPNPFNSSTTISYEIPNSGKVSITIHNVLGQRVVILMSGVVSPGLHSVPWDAKDLPSGIYFCRMEAGRFAQMKKVVVLK